MVGKLMKHEFIALFRTLAFFAGAILLLAILTRITFAIAAESPLFVLLYILFLFCAIILSAVPVVVSAERFYKSMFTGEGYLTFSLPVTAAQLIWAKLLSALIVSAACAVVSLVSFLIATPLLEFGIMGLLQDAFPALYELLIADPLVTFEFILYGILTIPSGFFYFYLILSIGQLFTNKRKLVTVLLFFGVSFVLSYAYVAVMSFVQVNNVHAVMWTLIGIYAAFDVGSFFAIRHILTHRVNLVMG